MFPLADGPHALLALVLVLAVLLVLAALLRWTYGTQADHKTPSGAGYGLLREVAVVASAEAAEVLRRRLAANRIRATVRPAADGVGRHILVFGEDYPTARLVLDASSHDT